MHTPSFYSQIEKDLKIIAKILCAEDDQYLEQEWRDLKWDIHELAETCKQTVKERKKRAEQEGM